jgi:GNAT superfamily N-acetyltransferase
MATGSVLVAVDQGRIAGCASIQRKADFAYAGRLAVDPQARGKGIGRRLMAEAESLARQMGAGRLRVDVRLALTENRAFFRTLGFVEGSHRCHPGFATPTYVELEKTLI